MNITNLTGYRQYKKKGRSASIERRTIQEIKFAEKEKSEKTESARRTTDVSEIKVNVIKPFDKFVKEIMQMAREKGALDIFDKTEYLNARDTYMVEQGIAPDRETIKQLLTPLMKEIEAMFNQIKYSSSSDKDEADPLDFFSMVMKFVFSDNKKKPGEQEDFFQTCIQSNPNATFPIEVDIGDLHLSIAYGGCTEISDKNGEPFLAYSPNNNGWITQQHTKAEHCFMDIADPIYDKAWDAGHREVFEKDNTQSLNVSV